MNYSVCVHIYTQGGSNMTGTDLYKRTHKSVPVIFEPPCIYVYIYLFIYYEINADSVHSSAFQLLSLSVRS